MFNITLTPEMQKELNEGRTIEVCIVDQDDQPRMTFKIIPTLEKVK